MTEPLSTVGIDRRRNLWLIARVRHESGRLTIDYLARCTDDQLGECEAVRSEHVVLAVPDNQALIKTLRLDGGGDRTRLAAFEMAQAVLADEPAFLFDAYPTGIGGLTIGLAIRREILGDEVIAPFQRAAGVAHTPAPMLRAIALGRGYASFAAPEGGDLTALVDLGGDPMSLCLVHSGRPVSVGWLTADRFDLTADSGCEQLAIELKTVLSFKQAALFEDGLTLPLSALLVTGMPAESPLLGAFRRYFSVRVAVPQVNTGYLADPATADPAPGDFLAALGLASI